MSEKLSALMDGELSESEMQAAIRELRSQGENQQCWESYHLIGDAMRKGLPNHMDLSFASRISDAIAQENVPATQPVPASPSSHPAQIYGLPKRVVGFAMAASVAVVAYVGFGMIAVDDQGSGMRVASVAPTTTLPIAKQVNVADGIRTVDARGWSEAKPAVESRLNNYLYSHRNLAGTAAMNNHMVSPSNPMYVLPERGQ